MDARPPATGTLEEWDTTWSTNPDIPIVAARVRHMTREEWMQRAIALAWKRHVIGKICYLGTDRDGVLLFSAPSSSMPGHSYQLRMDLSRKHIACPCTAASYGFPCGHIGAMWIYMTQMTMRMGPPSMALASTGPLGASIETGPLNINAIFNPPETAS